jgi:prefoldin subunit 5
MAISNTTSPMQRQQMIAEAAYYRAEKRGFSGGEEFHDWLEAEAEVDRRLRRRDIEHFVERLDEGLVIVNKQLTSLKKKASRLATEARADWQQDLEKLAKLRDTLKPKLDEIRVQGERVGQEVRQRAEKIWDEIAETTRRIGQKTQH